MSESSAVPIAAPSSSSGAGAVSVPGSTSAQTSAQSDLQAEGSFLVQCLGQIERGFFGEEDLLYCRYLFSHGADWTAVAGIESGLSQTACRSASSSCEHSEGGGVVWNFPIDVSFSSTNLHGWPRIAVSVYGLDFLGRDVVRGYGSALIPLQPGRHEISMDMFVPVASSPMNQFFSWMLGNPPEFFDSRFVCQGEGREVSRVSPTGRVSITLQVVIKGLEAFGYSL